MAGGKTRAPPPAPRRPARPRPAPAPLPARAARCYRRPVSDPTPPDAPAPEDAPDQGLPPPVDPTEGVPTRRLVRSLVVYLVLAFGLAWGLAAVLYVHYGPDALRVAPKTMGDHLALEAGLFGMMLCPGIAALVVRGAVVRQPLRDLGLTFGLYRGWLLAFVIPLGVVVAAFAVSYLVGPAHFDWALTHYRELLVQQGQDVAHFDKMPKLGLHAIFFVQAVIVGPVLGLPFALGEELGWRGHLTPILMRLLGRPAGLLVAGAIWGLWHLPIILMGHNYPGHPWLGAGLFVGFCVLLSPVLQWLFETSGSAWPRPSATGWSTRPPATSSWPPWATRRSPWGPWAGPATSSSPSPGPSPSGASSAAGASGAGRSAAWHGWHPRGPGAGLAEMAFSACQPGRGRTFSALPWAPLGGPWSRGARHPGYGGPQGRQNFGQCDSEACLPPPGKMEGIPPARTLRGRTQVRNRYVSRWNRPRGVPSELCRPA